MYDLIIVGAGPAGITSSIYAARAGLNVLLLEREFYGGKMNYTSVISNYPGYNSISGPELSEKMFNHAKEYGINFEYANIISSNLSDIPKILISSNGAKYYSKSVIIAIGLKTRMLNCPGEKKFKGRGVSYCATCDGFFFKDKDVAVVGGGNSAIEDASYLSNVCNKVYMIVRKDFFRGERFLSDYVIKNDKIKVLFNTSIKEIKGTDKVESLLLNSNGKNEEIDADGVFVDIGQEPIGGTFDEIKLNNFGYFDSDESCFTNIEGVFVAGDCRKKTLRQIITAASDGAVSTSNAIKYVKQLSTLKVMT